MYTPILGNKQNIGYSPVLGIPTTPSPIPPTEPISLQSFDSLLGTKTTTPQATDYGTVDALKTAGGYAKDVGQSINNSIASTALSLSGIIQSKIQGKEIGSILAEPIKAEDFKSYIAQGFFETMFGKGAELKSIEQRSLEAEPKFDAWKKEIAKISDMPNLNAREKFITKVLGNLDTPSTVFMGIMGSVGLDLTSFGGLEKNVFKSLIKEDTIEGGYQLLKRMGVAEDLAKIFAQDVPKIINEKQAKKFFENIVHLQETTKAVPYKPILGKAEQAIPEIVPKSTVEQGIDTTYKYTPEEIAQIKKNVDEINAIPFKDRTAMDNSVLAGGERFLEKQKQQEIISPSKVLGDTSVIEPKPSELFNKSQEIITKKTGELPQSLQEKQIEIEIKKEILSGNQAKVLSKYISKSGEFKGELREVLGKGKSLWGVSGDSIATEAGFADSEQAREAYLSYLKQKLDLKELQKEFQTAKKEFRSNEIINKLSDKIEKQNNYLRDLQKESPALAKLILRLSTNANPERAAMSGYKLGQKIGQQETRTSILNQLRIKQTSIASVQKQITNYVKENLPLNEQGKFINLIKDAKSQKDLTKAFLRIDNKVKKIELSNAITDLKNTAEKLTESPSVSADYRNKIKEIIGQYELTGHTNATIAKLEATQAFLNRTKSEGVETDISQRILDKLKILTRIPKDELTLSQVQGLQNEIELLGKLGETKWATKQALYEAEKEARKKILIDTASPINSKVLSQQPIGSDPQKWAERYIKLNNYAQKTRIGLTPIDALAEITGMKPMKATLDGNFGGYLSRTIPGVADFQKLENDMLELGNAISEGQRERVGVYGHKLQIDGYEKLANLGITKAEADAIILTPEEKKFYNAIQAFNDATYPAVKKYAMDTYNIDVGKIENYMSYMTDFNAMSGLEMYDRVGNLAEEAIRKTKKVEESFIKTRTGAGLQKIQLDALKIAQRHADDVAYMLTMGHDIKQYFEIVNSPEMRAKLGDVGALAWLQWLDLMARKGGTEGAKRIVALDIIRKNLGMGVLAFRLSSAIVQFSSFADTLATIGTEWATKGATSIATSKEMRNFIMDNFPEIRTAVGDDIAFREFGEGLAGKITQIGFKPLQFFDGLMRSTAAAGAYQKLAFEKGIAVDFMKPNKELIQEATLLMRQSQGSSFFKDQPLNLTTGFGLTNSKSLNKTILTFQSFMLSRWANTERQIWRLGIKEKNYAKAGMSAFYLIIVAAAIEEGLRRGTRMITNFITGDNQEEKSFVKNSALNIVQSVPLMGQLVSSLVYSSNPVPIINSFSDVGVGIRSLITGKSINTKARGATQALGGAGSLVGIPGSSQASQLIRKAIPQNTKKSEGGGLPKKITIGGGLPKKKKKI